MRECPKCGSTEISRSYANAKGCSWLFAILFIYTAFNSCEKGFGFIATCVGVALALFLFGKHYQASTHRCKDCGHEVSHSDIG